MSFDTSCNLRRKRARDPLVSIDPDLNDFENDIPNEDLRYLDDRANFYGKQEKFGTYTASTTIATSTNRYDAQGDLTEAEFLDKAPTDPCYEDFVKVKNAQNMWVALAWPAFAISVPMMILVAALLYICHMYRIDGDESIFKQGRDGMTSTQDQRYLLVDFPGTKIVFLASFLSTLAPLLAGCIMNLVAVLVYHELKELSDVIHFSILPTPYQLNLLIGVLAASYEQLLSAFGYFLSHKRTAKVSPVLSYAVSIFLLTIILGVSVAATDAFLHIATQTVSVTVYSASAAATLDLGRGINSYCLGVNRSENFGYPCTFASTTSLAKAPEWQNGQAEIQRIAHNTSVQSAVHVEKPGDIVYLTPALIPQGVDFAATTIGIRGKCSLIASSAMNISVWGSNNVSTSFNYSSNFWGTLGITPPESALGTGKALSPYLAFLSINQNANLIYNYFADENLSIVYNTADLNASAWPTETSRPWPDADLKNPIYLGFAWRTATSSFAGFSKNGMVSSKMVHKYQSGSFIDYFLKCEMTSYNVTYVAVNGTMSMIDAVKHDNGTILNMWTGMAAYFPRVSASDFNLQDYNIQSAIAGNTTETYLTKFGDLLAHSALSTIGAFTSSRDVLRQQPHNTLLVAKVPKSALGSLLACSLLYPVLGFVLLGKALQASKKMGPMAPIFSYWGLTWAAFLQSRQDPMQEMTEARTKSQIQDESLRICIGKHEGSGSRFCVYKRSETGLVAEVEQSQTNIATWV